MSDILDVLNTNERYSDMKELPLLLRFWICITNFRSWRTRRAIDKAVVLMLRDGIETDAAYNLLEISNRLWDEAFRPYETR